MVSSNPFSEALVKIMIREELTQDNIVKTTGVRSAQISHYIAGYNLPTLPVFCKIITAYFTPDEVQELTVKMSEFYDQKGGKFKTATERRANNSLDD